MKGALKRINKHESDNDYILRENGNSVWIEVDGALLHIRRLRDCPRGVRVEFYKNLKGGVDRGPDQKFDYMEYEYNPIPEVIHEIESQPEVKVIRLVMDEFNIHVQNTNDL